MSGVKHTPWKHEWVEESSDWAVFGCVYPPDAGGIAHQPGICTLSDFCDEDEARLIAAAPDLLESLIHARSVLQMMTDPEAIQSSTVINVYAQAIEAERKAGKAIARARGVQDGGAE